MKHNRILIFTGVLVASGFVVSTLYSFRGKQRDKLAAALLREIEKKLRPGSGLATESAFDISFADRVVAGNSSPVITLREEKAQQYAGEIKSAWKPWYKGGDDEEKVYSVFRRLKDKVQVSQVAKAYSKAYGTNLIDALNDRLDTGEIRKVQAIIDRLHPFRTI